MNTTEVIRSKVDTLLDGVSATGASGSWLKPAKNVLFQVSGITTATVEIQGSLDGSTWTTLSSLTADGSYANSDPWKYMQANVTAYTSGTITVRVGS